MLGWRRNLIYWLLFCAIYSVFAMICLETRDPWSLSTVVWMPAGLLLGTLCTCPSTSWPIWSVSAGVLHVFFSMQFGRSLDIALTFALLDLAVLIPLAMMWKSAHRYLDHLSYRAETLLLLLGVYIGSILGGLISTLTLMFMEYPVILPHFFTWSLSNAVGCLSGTPFLVTRNLLKEKPLSLSFTSVICVLLVAAIFFIPSSLLETAILSQILLYLVLGISLLLSVMWPLSILTLYFFSLTLLVSLTTLYDYGPLASTAFQGVQYSQLYLLEVISLGLLVAAHEKEHVVQKDKQQQQLHLVGHLLQQPFFFQLLNNDADIHWQCHGSVFDIPIAQMPTLQLLLARIHPEDRPHLSGSLAADKAMPRAVRQCTLRLLLADQQYHRVCCTLVYGHPQVGTLGVFMLSD